MLVEVKGQLVGCDDSSGPFLEDLFNVAELLMPI
jgi:hypothetical protein